MFYPTVSHVSANSVGDNLKCDICDKQFVRSTRRTGKYRSLGKTKAKFNAPLLAVFRPSRSSICVPVQDLEEKVSKAVERSPLFRLPPEVRIMIWKLVIERKWNEPIDILPLRLCPHVHALEFRVCREGPAGWKCHCKSYGFRDCRFNCKRYNYCCCYDRRCTSRRSNIYNEASGILVCKLMQLEILQAILSTQTLHFVDAPRMPFNLNGPSTNPADPTKEDSEADKDENEYHKQGVMNFRSKYGKATVGGFDLFLDTFRPFCGLIKSMRVSTFLDGDCVDLSQFEKSEPESWMFVTKYHQGPVSDLRLEPHTVLRYPRLPSIFAGLCELHIQILPQPEGTEARLLPRCLVKKEFLALFRHLGNFQLQAGSVNFAPEWCYHWYATEFGYKGPKPNHNREFRRDRGRQVEENFLSSMARDAEDIMMRRSDIDEDHDGREVENGGVKVQNNNAAQAQADPGVQNNSAPQPQADAGADAEDGAEADTEDNNEPEDDQDQSNDQGGANSEVEVDDEDQQEDYDYDYDEEEKEEEEEEKEEKLEDVCWYKRNKVCMTDNREELRFSDEISMDSDQEYYISSDDSDWE